MNYWIFQGRPDAYDFSQAIKENVLTEWNVKQYKDEIKDGDKAIIWLTGPDAGCYALADVMSNPDIIGKSADHHLWNMQDPVGLKHKAEDATTTKVKIKITHNLLSSRYGHVPKGEIHRTAGLENFRAGRPGSIGTNLRISQDEFSIVKTLVEHKLELIQQ